MFSARLIGCEGSGNAGVGSGGGVVVVSAYMGGTRGSCVLASAGGVQEMSVVRDVGVVCHMCMCLTRGRLGGVGGEWVTGLDFGVTNLEEHGESRICVWIPAHLMCTQCSSLLNLIDICFLTCICMWQISQIQTCLRVVFGPRFSRHRPL